MSEQIVDELTKHGDIETEAPKEVVRDFEAVLANYLSLDRDATEQAKNLMESRGLPQSELGRIKRLSAEKLGIKTGEDMLDYLLDQFLEMLMHSHNVEEVFVEDHELRRRMRPIVRKHIEMDEAVDQEVRGRLKHLQEGTRSWEIEYQRVIGDIQRRKGLV